MGRHELCLLSGIHPGGGPTNLVIGDEELELVVALMVDEIKPYSKIPPSSLAPILRESLVLTANPDDETWKPPGLGDWPYFRTCVAIGYFGDCDAYYHNNDDEPRFPGGRNVEVRRVFASSDLISLFDYVITGESVSQRSDLGSVEKTFSDCSVHNDNPNFFVLEGCYRYLEAWINWDSLPPRILAFPNDPEPMSFASEFYEIVNSRTKPREAEDDPYGILPCISYGGIEKTCTQYQDEFVDARCGSEWTARAIADGLRGKDLIPSLMRDFGAWMCMRSDIWPTPSTTGIPQYRVFEQADPQGRIHDLPSEILLEIFECLPISTILTFSTTCRFIRNYVTNRDVQNIIMRAAVLSPTGFLRWLLPVQTVNGEVKRATSAAHQWLASTYALAEIEPQSPESPFTHHSFPFYAFVPACLIADTTLSSMSMRNRRRFWDIVQQFEIIWKDYRTKGWERKDVFARFGIDEAYEIGM